MRYGSVCSGIEAATVAWHPLGWEAAWYSEIEPFPCAVLKHHYPAVSNYGDMTKFEEWPNESIDLLVGGTPCQSFSVAGLRKGLADPRGNLMLTFLAIAQRHRPRWIVWENVPGVLSSNGGRDFGTFLGALGELGYGWAYRVLDAQWFGVAQRRRRVFVVGYLGDWQRPAQVLFERESVRRDTPPSREARQDVAATIAARFGVSRNNHEELAWDEHGVQRTVGTLCADTHPGAYSGQDAYTGRLVPHTHYRKFRRAQSVTDHETWVEDDATNTLNCFDVGDVRATDVVAQPVKGSHWDSPLHPHPTLNQSAKGSGGIAASDQELFSQRGSGLVAQPVAFRDPSPTLTAKMQGSSGWAPANEDAHLVGVAQPMAFQQNTRDEVRYINGDGQIAGALAAEAGMKQTNYIAETTMQVRRLTPVECERLQGFPDNYTNIPWRKKPESPDGPRYKALGNSMAVPVMRWIGQRIQKVSEL